VTVRLFKALAERGGLVTGTVWGRRIEGIAGPGPADEAPTVEGTFAVTDKGAEAGSSIEIRHGRGMYRRMKEQRETKRYPIQMAKIADVIGAGTWMKSISGRTLYSNKRT
jgi:hypothetical protein